MIRRFVLKLSRRRRLQQELETELAFHREMAASAGNPIPLGNAAHIQEQAFDLWRFNRTENLWRDLAYAVRTLRRSPGLVISALLSLGLGIGVNAAIFSLAVEFLLSQPSVRDASSVVYVRQAGNSHMQSETIEQLRRGGLFTDIAGENEESFINFNNGFETRHVYALQATKNYFTALGIPLAQGRGFTESDPDSVVVLHPRFWRTALSGDPSVIGRTIRLDGRPYTVLGVLRENFRSLVGYGYAPDVFVPRYINNTVLAAYARMLPGMTIGQLNAALPALGRRLDLPASASADDRTFHATPVSGIERLKMENDAGAVTLFFAALLVIVGLVLLVACANVAGLFLARASARRQEIAIRLALGAGRARLLQQLLSESLLLSLSGAALGFAFALGAAKAAAAVPLPFPVPIHLHIDPDWRVLAYAAALAIFSAIASGLLPAWQAVKESLSAGVRRERKMHLRRALVIAQIAVSFVVLAAAALFLQNLARTTSLGPGFDTSHTIRAEVYLPPAAYQQTRAVNGYATRALEQLRAIPGVEAAAGARILPFRDNTRMGSDFKFSNAAGKRHVQFSWNAVTPEFFRAMGIPVKLGRAFTARDNGSEHVVIVNDVFVRNYLGGGEAVGVTFAWYGGAVFRIVGVVPVTKTMTIGETPRPQLYEPLAQIDTDRSRLQFVVRSALPPASQLAAVRAALRDIEPAAGLEVETMFSAIGFAFLPSQVGAALTGFVGALGLLLVIIGLYGVLAYSVTRRTREIGIRIAIGASSRDVSRVVLGELATLLTFGLVIGFGVAFFLTKPLALFLVPGLSPSNPASFFAVTAVLAVTGFLAGLGPLRRALTVNPLECLRYE